MMTNDVVMKDVAPQWIASMRAVLPAFRAIGGLFGKLYGALGPLRSEGMGVAPWHDREYKDHDLDLEAGGYLKQAVPVGEPLTVYELPAARARLREQSIFKNLGNLFAANHGLNIRAGAPSLTLGASSIASVTLRVAYNTSGWIESHFR